MFASAQTQQCAPYTLTRENCVHAEAELLQFLARSSLRPLAEYSTLNPSQTFPALTLGVKPLFTRKKRTVFAFKGDPWLPHRLTDRRVNHSQLQVRALKKESTPEFRDWTSGAAQGSSRP